MNQPHGKDAGELALTPFDLPDEGAAASADTDLAAGEPEDTSVVLYRNTVTQTWEPDARPEAEAQADEQPEPGVDGDDDEADEKGGWTVALVCAGVALVAVCLLLPLAEENHQLAYQ